MGFATALLSRRRVAAFVAAAACVVTWFIVAPHLPRIGLWPAIVLVSGAIIPGTLLLAWIALPLWNRRWLFAAVIACALLALLFTVVGWGLPANFAKLAAAVFAGWAFLVLFERVSWVVVAYLVAGTIAAPVYGQLRDVYGGRRMMFLALAIFLGASLFCAMATSIEMLTIGRILQGLGGGGLMTLTQALIGEAIPPRDRARYQGYLAGVAGSSSTFGPVVGGLLTVGMARGERRWDRSQLGPPAA